MPSVDSSDASSATVTQSLTPSKESARPKYPSATRDAPEMTPLFPSCDESTTAFPDGSSNENASTRPSPTDACDVPIVGDADASVASENAARRASVQTSTRGSASPSDDPRRESI